MADAGGYAGGQYPSGWDYNDPSFVAMLMSAQDGHAAAQQLVVMASVPIVWSLSPDADEAQNLFVHILEYVIPKWDGVMPWALRCTVCCRSRLLTLRRTRQRRRDRGLGWL